MRRSLVRLARIAISVVMTCTLVSAQPVPNQSSTGTRPPALAPFAADDPIPAVEVKVHDQPNTSSGVAETFLAHMSHGYGIPGFSIIGADPSGYEKAWSLMAPGCPSLVEFTRRWSQTVAIKVVQFEPAQGNQFFVELQVLERCGELWNVGYYSGFLKTVQTEEGWRVRALEIWPEDLLGINVAGHQGWQHDEELMAIYSLHRPQEESWRAVRTEYAGRKAEVHLQNTATGQNRTVRLIRTLEGSWALLGIRVDPEENGAPD